MRKCAPRQWSDVMNGPEWRHSTPFFRWFQFSATFPACTGKEGHVMRNTTAALAMGAVLAVAPAVSAQSRPAAGGTPIIVVVSVADHANVPLKTLIAAEEDAAAIYGAAGVQTLWVNVPSEPVVTQIAGRTRDLRLNLLSRELTGT